MGWSDFGGTFETRVWDKAEGTIGSELDASGGISSEAGQLCLFLSQSRGSQEVSTRVKKTQKSGL